MASKPNSASHTVAVTLMVGITLTLIGGRIEGPTWAKIALVVLALGFIVFALVRGIAASKSQQNRSGQAGGEGPGPHA